MELNRNDLEASFTKKSLKEMPLPTLQDTWQDLTGKRTTIGNGAKTNKTLAAAKRRLVNMIHKEAERQVGEQEARFVAVTQGMSLVGKLDRREEAPDGHRGIVNPCPVCQATGMHKCCTSCDPGDRTTADGFQEVEDRFGFRKIGETRVPQTWCRRCRSHKPAKAPAAKLNKEQERNEKLRRELEALK